jgi:hypothetical protein
MISQSHTEIVAERCYVKMLEVRLNMKVCHRHDVHELTFFYLKKKYVMSIYRTVCENIAIIFLDQLLDFCDMRQEQFVIRPFPSPPAALERMRTFLKLRSTHSSRTGSSKTRETKNSAAQKRSHRRPRHASGPRTAHLNALIGPDGRAAKNARTQRAVC